MDGMSGRSRAGATLALMLLVAWIADGLPAEAGGASRTRPGSSSGSGSSAGGRAPASRPASGTVAGRAARPSSGDRQRASGTATYGYGRYGGGHYHPWYGTYWDSWGWWGGGWGFGWGIPHYSVGLWWPPAPYAGPVRYVERVGERDEPAFIETIVRPRKATVRLDGEEVGRAKDYSGSWDRLVVAPGRRWLEFSAPGYQTLRVRVDAKPGRIYQVERELSRGEGDDPRSIAVAEPQAAEARAEAPPPEPRASGLGRGFLKFGVFPSDATVYLDGEFLASARELGALHGAVAVAEGEHRVEVLHPSFAPKSVEVRVAARETVQVEIRLDERSAE